MSELSTHKSDIFESIEKLPDELIREIFYYIPCKHLVFLNKKYYIDYHIYINKLIINYDSFIRNIIRMDNDFIFSTHMSENNKKWIAKKKYYYKNKIYSNYSYFLLDYCIENSSDRCKEKLTNFWHKEGLCQNRHKKNISKHIRWKK